LFFADFTYSEFFDSASMGGVRKIDSDTGSGNSSWSLEMRTAQRTRPRTLFSLPHSAAW